MRFKRENELMASTYNFHQHPDFELMRPYWEQYRDLFEGKHKVMTSSKYLPYHQLELQRENQDATLNFPTSAVRQRSELRAIRVQNTNYTNFICPILDIWKGLYFRKDIYLSEDALEMLGDALDDIDGEGCSLQGFLRDEIFENDYLYGRPIILVDAPSADTNNPRAYFTLLDPLSVKDWHQDDTGKLQFIRWEYVAIPERQSPQDEPKEKLFTRILQLTERGFTSAIYSAEKDDYTAEVKAWHLEQEPIEITGFDSLPIVWKRFGESAVKDYSEEILRHHKLESSLDNGLAAQAWQRLYATGIDNTDAGQVAALTAYTLFLLPEGGTMGQVEPAEPQALERRIARQQDLIFRKAMRQLRALPSDSRAVQAAETLREEQNNMISIIKSRLNDYQVILNDALYFYALYMGVETRGEYEIKLDDDITDQDISQTLMLFQALQTDFKQLPETKKQFLKAMIKDAPIADVPAAMVEVDSANFETPQASRLLQALAGE